MRYNTLHEVQKQTYVACFTETVDKVLMWSHYARSHSGFALGFDFSLPENQKAKEMLFRVVYSDEKIDMTMDIGFVADRHIEGDYKYATDILCGPKSSLFKSTDWAYEREWRYTIRDIENQKEYGSVPLKATAIYYGCKMSKEYFDLLHALAKLKGLKEYQMCVTPFDKEYRMIVLDLGD